MKVAAITGGMSRLIETCADERLSWLLTAKTERFSTQGDFANLEFLEIDPACARLSREVILIG